MSTLLTPPKYFKLAEIETGTVLVENGFLKKEAVSERFGNRQFYFFDKADRQLKCLSGGSLNYIIDEYGLDSSDNVRIKYAGTSEVQNGKFAGKQAHQFEVELLDDVEPSTERVTEENTDMGSSDNLDNLV